MEVLDDARAAVSELVVHAVEALDHRLLDLVDALALRRHAGIGIDPADRVVVNLYFQIS